MINSKMDILYISLCFITIFPSSLGLDPIELKFENASRVDVLDGATDVIFRCHLNRKLIFLFENQVSLVHTNPATKKETTLATSTTLLEGSPEFYEKGVKEVDENNLIFEFKFLKVRSGDDGFYKCHLKPKDGASITSDEKELLVHRPMSSLKLKLGEYDAVEDSPSDPLAIDHGSYKLACIAEGSNPGTEDIHLFFNEKMMEHDKPVIEQIEEADGRLFKSELSADVNVMVNNSGQEFVCQARDSTGQPKTIKLKIQVNIYDPIVSCNDSEAHLGQANPVLYCTVNHTGLEVTGYGYQLGDTLDVIKAGADHPKNIQVTVSNVSPDVAVVALDLHKAEQEYFNKNYYIVVYMAGGHKSKESVRLHMKEGGNHLDINDGGHGERISPVILLYVLMFVAAFWSSH